MGESLVIMRWRYPGFRVIQTLYGITIFIEKTERRAIMHVENLLHDYSSKSVLLLPVV
jgi:hypothetical protein